VTVSCKSAGLFRGFLIAFCPLGGEVALHAAGHGGLRLALTVLSHFEERSLWRSQSMDWMRANREAFQVSA
jgi:hypothetical protein